jgi:hypothetical protein
MGDDLAYGVGVLRGKARRREYAFYQTALLFIA